MSRIAPAQIPAGLTFSHLVTLPDYPAPDWALTLSLRGPATIDVLAAAEGNQHLLEAAATATALYSPGLYRYTLRAAYGGVVREIENGSITVAADLAASTTPADVRSHARIVLDNIRAVIEKRATQDQQKYSINNRELWRTPIADLLKLENQYAARVRAEDAKAAGGGVFGKSYRVRLK